MNELIIACDNFIKFNDNIGSEDSDKLIDYYSKLAKVNECCHTVGMTIEFCMAVLNKIEESEEA